MKDDNKYSEIEVVDILGGKLKRDGKKSITSIMLVLVFAVAVISPFGSYVVEVDKREDSTTTVSTTVAKASTTKKPVATKPKSTETTETKINKTTSTTTVASTKREEAPTRQVVEPQTTAPTTVAVTTEKAEQTTEEVTTPFAKVESTSKSSTTKAPTTTYVEKTTQKPTTTTQVPTKKIVPEIEAWPDNCRDFVIVNYCAYPQGGNFSLRVSEGSDVVKVRDDRIYPIKTGKATVDVLWTYEDKVAKDTLNITVGVQWSDSYETELKQETNDLNVLASLRQEHQLYRWVCNACGYHDCYVKTETTTCRDSYPHQNNCNGKFTVLETRWFSDIDPQTMSCHSFSGINSVLLGDGSEWYWTGSTYNATKTVYEYKTGTYYIESIT